MPKPYVIKISSQKGGVGKTTMAVNLSAALQEMGSNVLLVDFDIANPSVGFHLGIEGQNLGVQNILLKGAKPEDVIIPHAPTGLHVIPGNMTYPLKEPSAQNIKVFFTKLKRLNYDYLIFDTAPGFFLPEFSAECNEAIIIATPELSSCVSSVRLSNIYKKHGLKSQLLINRIRNKRYELHPAEIEETFGSKALGLIPEDETVPKSIAMHVPAYILNRKSIFSRSVYDTAHFFPSNGYNSERDPVKLSGGILSFIKRLFRIKSY